MNNNEITTSLINKTNSITKYLEKFDNIFKILISIDDDLKPENNQQIAEITELFIKIRSEHGGLLIILDKLKDKISSQDTQLSEEMINNLYTLSTFNSIINDISSVIQNIDFEYKKIALKFPKFINKKVLTLVLIINDNENNKENDNENNKENNKENNEDNNEENNEENKFLKIIKELTKSNPENVYRVIRTNKNKINIKDIDISGDDLLLNTENKPILFMINDGVITNISLKENDTIEKLRNLIS